MNNSDTSAHEELMEKVKSVKHPAINHTLFDLGILKSINLSADTAQITMAFPFPNIPIAEQLINSICSPIKEEGITCTVETTVMTPEERQRFLGMEKAAWIG